MKNLLLNKEIPSSADYVVVAYDSKEGKVSFKGGSQPTPPQPTFEYVDLGLPSGLKWAKCNVGATSEEEVGKYFQWGDTIGYYEGNGAEEHSTWATAPFNGGQEFYSSTEFAKVSGTVCPNNILVEEYDAVYQATNGTMRMPNAEDVWELATYTTCAYKKVNGVSGYKFINKNDESKYIFIPSSGRWVDGTKNSSDARTPFLWSSQLQGNNWDSAIRLGVDYFSDVASTDASKRYYATPLRGVLVA